MHDDIASWLQELGLGEYAATFAEHAIDRDVLPDLSEIDLEKIGVKLGHRKKLLKAIRALTEAPTGAAATDVEPSTAGMGAEAERRQLTVMFCDLVGSTALSTRIDPEDYREVIRTYQDTCAGVITRFDGYVAKFLGDGVLAYFGWPRGHEDDAARAISAGLGVIEAVGDIAFASA